MDPVVYLISDLHLGPGREPATDAWHPLEDFQVDDAFGAFLDRITALANGAPIELLIAGDFIDYPQILPELGLTSPANTRGTTQAESVERTRVVLGQRPELSSGHPAVFARLRKLIEAGHSVTILVGNHDIDLLWPDVWALLFDAIYSPGASGILQRETFSHTIGRAGRGRVYVEHGHERDPENCFGDQMAQPFAEDGTGVRRLKRCYGTLFVDKVYNQLERERWFIDNVKPISRVIGLGLKNDVGFTGRALALILKFFLTAGLPPRRAAAVLGEEDTWPQAQRNGPALAQAVDDDQLHDYLQRRMADPAFRAEFDDEVRQFDEGDWRQIKAGVTRQPTLDKLAGVQPRGMVLGDEDVEDQYHAAAREVMQLDSSIGAVIMGHTHEAIDGLVKPLYLDDNRTGYYFNSGTWTPHLRDRPGHRYGWDEIADAANYTSSLTYLRFVPDAQGVYRVELHSWAAEM